MRKKAKYLILLLFFSGSCFSQSSLPVFFHFVFEGRALVTGTAYDKEAHNTTISAARMYVSQFAFYKQGRKVAAFEDSYFLLDAERPESQSRKLTIPDGLAFDEVRFLIGIDEKTNAAGIGSGDLDPAKGMYWAWQSGYINMKLEGKTQGKEFTYHIGGFLAPYLSAREVRLPVNNTDTISICVDIKKLLDGIDVKLTPHIMSPGTKAMTMSDSAAKMFSICQ